MGRVCADEHPSLSGLKWTTEYRISSGFLSRASEIQRTLPDMGEITLWTGLPGSGKSAAAVERVVVQARAGHSVWWVVDTRARADRIERCLLDESPEGLAGVQVILTAQLAQQVVLSDGALANTVSSSVRELVFRALLGDSEYRDRWNPPDSAGWVRKASQIFDRLHGIADNPITGELLDVRIPWMRELFRRYDDWLKKQDALDQAFLPQIAADEIRAGSAVLPDELILDRPR